VELDSNAALILIDVQQGFDDPRWGRRNNPEAEQKIALLLDQWRSAGRPIVHVRHDSKTDGSALRLGNPGNDFKREAATIADEAIYPKSVHSAFIGTSLERDLRRRGVSTLVIVGLTTNHCVSTTARMAGNLGFETFVVSDATATFDRIGIDGILRDATDVHAAALSDLHGEFATVVESSALLVERSEA
jgi:nicotinamidase-related amidase